jgi:hypothetical protein
MPIALVAQSYLIEFAIRFEPDPNNSNVGVFHLTLHHPNRGAVAVPVTQTDIDDDLRRESGGIADNKKGNPILPSVMETAFAKQHDPNPQDNNLDDAYLVIIFETSARQYFLVAF